VLIGLHMTKQAGKHQKAPLDPSLQLTIHLLGGFRVNLGGNVIPCERWRLRKGKSLLKLLALAPRHHLYRDQLIELLWPDSDPKAAANTFYQVLHAARQVLDPSGAQGKYYLFLQDEQLTLCPHTPLWIDVDAFEQQAALARTSHDGAAYQAALALYPGDLLPEDRYEAWSEPRRAALHEQYLVLLFELALLYEGSQNTTEAVAVLNKLIAIDSTHEEAHALLIRLYARSGQRVEAIHQYQILKDVLHKELAIEPAPDTTRMYEDILHGRVAGTVRSETPQPLRPQHNLPVQLSSFIGREREIEAVMQLLLEHRLVTVTGAGGIGKTRLALQAAGKLLDRFAHGAWLVELAPISDPALVARAVIDALDILVPPTQDLFTSLDAFLQSRHLLLVLDNCEHVINEAAALSTHLLHTCRNLHILATSREALRVEGEQAFYCPSLSLPDEHSDVSKSESVRLFADRAQSIWPGFTLNEVNSGRVVQICQRLDGIPLAIELAAARTRMLSVEQIAARLDHAFCLLTGGSRSEMPRHQTLKAMIDWSYDLLSPQARLLLMRLSLFAGSWTLEAAEQVCADPVGDNSAVQLRKEQILDLLGLLIAKSLIQYEPSERADPRYRMLETVRQYTRERMAESGGSEKGRERHLDYYRDLALQAEPYLRAWQAKYWLDRLDQELENLRLALEWSLTSSIEKGLQLTAAIFWFWWIRFRSREGTEWLERLLHAQESRIIDTDGKVARGRALNALVHIRKFGSNAKNNPQMKKLAEESRRIFEALGEAYQRDLALSRLSGAETEEELLECRCLFQTVNDRFWISECDQFLSGKYPPKDERSFFYAQECLALRQEIGDLDGEGIALFLLGGLEEASGNIDRAGQLLRQALISLETVKNRSWTWIVRNNVALFYIRHGHYVEAAQLLDSGEAEARALNDSLLLYWNFVLQSFLLWSKKELEAAGRTVEKALELGRNYPIELRFYSLYALARLALARGEAFAARHYLKDILEVLSDEGFRFRIIQVLGGLAVLEGQMQRAAILFGALDAEYQKIWWGKNALSAVEMSENEQALAAVRAVLGKKDFSAAWEAGHALTDEQVIAYALEDN
jgi:predicted ATPase/DNA-binding SARP family transcriptional activator